jgi:hypothetical protein
VPRRLQFGQGIVLPVQVVSGEGKEREQGKMDREPCNPAVPGDEREEQNRGRECSREGKTAERPFQRRVKRGLEQGEHGKPAGDEEDLLFSWQEAHPRPSCC